MINKNITIFHSLAFFSNASLLMDVVILVLIPLPFQIHCDSYVALARICSLFFVNNIEVMYIYVYCISWTCLVNLPKKIKFFHRKLFFWMVLIQSEKSSCYNSGAVIGRITAIVVATQPLPCHRIQGQGTFNQQLLLIFYVRSSSCQVCTISAALAARAQPLRLLPKASVFRKSGIFFCDITTMQTTAVFGSWRGSEVHVTKYPVPR